MNSSQEQINLCLIKHLPLFKPALNVCLLVSIVPACLQEEHVHMMRECIKHCLTCVETCPVMHL